jgi:hypothetical protein
VEPAELNCLHFLRRLEACLTKTPPSDLRRPSLFNTLPPFVSVLLAAPRRLCLDLLLTPQKQPIVGVLRPTSYVKPVLRHCKAGPFVFMDQIGKCFQNGPLISAHVSGSQHDYPGLSCSGPSSHSLARAALVRLNGRFFTVSRQSRRHEGYPSFPVAFMPSTTIKHHTDCKIRTIKRFVASSNLVNTETPICYASTSR